MNEQSKNNTKNVFVVVIIIMLAILAGGWYYLQNLNPTFKIESDQSSYFTVDHPEIQIKLINRKDAESGELTVSYDTEILELEEILPSNGVTNREIENTIIFDLSKEYLNSKNEIIAKLKFKGTAEIGEAKINIDKEKSSLINVNQELMQINLEEKTIEIGITPDRSENKISDEKSF
ncbi:hypothetical protein KKD70_03300 [Patescibacteria group bacterium]|nr:hypothetical protein [Patescibacteria group bacterium]